MSGLAFAGFELEPGTNRVRTMTEAGMRYAFAYNPDGELCRDDALGLFHVQVAPGGVTSVPGVFACGEVAGPCTARAAAAQGESAGRLAADFISGSEASTWARPSSAPATT